MKEYKFNINTAEILAGDLNFKNWFSFFGDFYEEEGGVLRLNNDATIEALNAEKIFEYEFDNYIEIPDNVNRAVNIMIEDIASLQKCGDLPRKFIDCLHEIIEPETYTKSMAPVIAKLEYVGIKYDRFEKRPYASNLLSRLGSELVNKPQIIPNKSYKKVFSPISEIVLEFLYDGLDRIMYKIKKEDFSERDFAIMTAILLYNFDRYSNTYINRNYKLFLDSYYFKLDQRATNERLENEK